MIPARLFEQFWRDRDDISGIIITDARGSDRLIAYVERRPDGQWDVRADIGGWMPHGSFQAVEPSREHAIRVLETELVKPVEIPEWHPARKGERR